MSIDRLIPPAATTSLSGKEIGAAVVHRPVRGPVLQISAIIFSMLSGSRHWRPARRPVRPTRANVTGSLLENFRRRPQMKTCAPWRRSPGKSPCRAPSAAGHEDAFSLEEVSVEHERANPANSNRRSTAWIHGFAKLIHYCTSSVNRFRVRIR